MLFNSIEFLFFFLPFVFVVFYGLQRIGQPRLVKAWLVVASLFFYAWWNPVYLVLLLFSLITNYSLGVVLARAEQPARRVILILGVFFNLALLGYFKYGNFFIENIQVLTNISFNFSKIVLPLAVSFYTFLQITYLVDSSKRLTAPHDLLDYSLFVTFFPQLVAGPIVHHKEMLGQIRRLGQRDDAWRNLSIGGSILAIGLFKKAVIAEGFGGFATPIFDLAASGHQLFTLDALSGTFSWFLQLYFDFSGYSDMAIGLACLFGLKLPVNFFSPFRARNISDFWRMWHATLSRFLRDYVYSPMGGFICSPSRQRVNLFITMFLAGIWHGAGWTFFLYGVWLGTYMVLHQLWRIKISGPLGLVGNRVYQVAAMLFTFLVCAFTSVVFRADTIAAAGRIYHALFHPGQWTFTTDYLMSLSTMSMFTFMGIRGIHASVPAVVFGSIGLGLLACWLLPNTWQLFKAFEVTVDKNPPERPAVIKFAWQPRIMWSFYTAVLLVFSFLNLTHVSKFIYFQF